MGRGKLQYASSHEIALAYQVVGDGPVDLIYLRSNISNVGVNWENPEFASFLTELAGLGGLVVVDRRGLGCSERFIPDGIPQIGTRKATEALSRGLPRTARCSEMFGRLVAPRPAVPYPSRCHGGAGPGNGCSAAAELRRDPARRQKYEGEAQSRNQLSPMHGHSPVNA
jgi:hypothetical protein